VEEFEYTHLEIYGQEWLKGNLEASGTELGEVANAPKISPLVPPDCFGSSGRRCCVDRHGRKERDSDRRFH